MSERFLKYETEADNSLVDEKGVLKPSGATGGGYVYYGISFAGSSNRNIYKMNEDHTATAKPNPGSIDSDVKFSEFLNAYMSHPIMIIPIDASNGEALYVKENSDLSDGSLPRIVIGFSIYAGKHTIRTGEDDGNSGRVNTTFQAE